MAWKTGTDSAKVGRSARVGGRLGKKPIGTHFKGVVARTACIGTRGSLRRDSTWALQASTTEVTCSASWVRLRRARLPWGCGWSTTTVRLDTIGMDGSSLNIAAILATLRWRWTTKALDCWLPSTTFDGEDGRLADDDGETWMLRWGQKRLDFRFQSITKTLANRKGMAWVEASGGGVMVFKVRVFLGFCWGRRRWIGFHASQCTI